MAEGSGGYATSSIWAINVATTRLARTSLRASVGTVGAALRLVKAGVAYEVEAVVEDSWWVGWC